MIHTATAPKVHPLIRLRPCRRDLDSATGRGRSDSLLLPRRRSSMCGSPVRSISPRTRHTTGTGRGISTGATTARGRSWRLIRASCELFGPLSLQTTGKAAAVRLPAALCHGATLAAWYVLAAGILRSPRVGLMVVAAGVAHAGGADRFRDHDNRSALSRVLVDARVRVEGDRAGTPRWWFGRDSRLASVSWPSTRCCFYRPRWWGSACFIGVASSAGRACGSCSPERRPGGRPSCSGTRGTTGCRSAMSSDRWVAGARAGASGGWAPCSSSAARRE